MSAPLPLRYDGDGQFTAPRGWRARADAEFVIGEVYQMDPFEARNMAQHRGYFARIREAWQNLPEDLAEAYPSPESLRKRALIKSGYAALTEFLAASSKHAAEAATAFTKADPFALVVIEDRAVRIWRAESQSVKAMGKERFKESMDATEHWIAALIGVTPEEYARAA